MSRKHLRGKDISISLLLKQVNNETHPIIRVLVDGYQCMALVDTGCSKTLMSTSVCHYGKFQNIDILTADGKILRCHRTSQVDLVVDCMHPLHLEVIVIKGKLLGFNLLLGFDTIKRLGSVHLSDSGEFHFPVKNLPRCAVIKIN